MNNLMAPSYDNDSHVFPRRRNDGMADFKAFLNVSSGHGSGEMVCYFELKSKRSHRGSSALAFIARLMQEEN